ncbi:hypothetical protein ABW19_dt0207493 [Dactylella cylindrospora]|nr:hypothetical protein ABW19_dt0207493 [Dactylella cylindrospora]
METQQLCLTSLPIELLIKVLKSIGNPKSVLPAILSCRKFHDAYQEEKEFEKELLLNSVGENARYCKYLTTALRLFHDERSISIEYLNRFVVSYLGFEELGRAVGEILLSPEPFPELFTVHRYIGLWSIKFCDELLKIHPITGHPTTEAPPPTPLELARVSRAFYQLFLYFSLFKHRRYSYEVVDEVGVSTTRDGKYPKSTAQAYLESIPYLEFYMIHNHILPWLRTEMEPNIVFPEHSNLNTDGIQNGWIIRLGPIKLYDLLYQSTNVERVTVFSGSAKVENEGLMDAWNHFEQKQRQLPLFDPLLRIVHRREWKIQQGDYNWWQRADAVAGSAVIWEEWRLRRWGLMFPEVEEVNNPKPCSERKAKSMERNSPLPVVSNVFQF